MKIVANFNIPITDKIMSMYNYFSADRNGHCDNIDTYIGFSDFMETANDKVYNNNNTFKETEKIMERFIMPDSDYSNTTIMVGYSSGFDSTFQALRFKKRGFNVVLLHCNDLNKSYPDEKEKAKEFADYYDMQLVTVDIKYDKSQPNFFIDNPIKNQIVLSLMIDYGIQYNINKFALGNNVYENINECRSQYGISDSIENFNLFRQGIKQYIENIYFYDIDIHKHECYRFVAENYPEAFKFINSCISPHRFKRYLNKTNREKYGIEPLSDTRCMSCYKCAIEYIILSHYNFIKTSEEYLKQCYNIIRKKSDTIFTTKVANKNSTNEEIERNIFNA